MQILQTNKQTKSVLNGFQTCPYREYDCCVSMHDWMKRTYRWQRASMYVQMRWIETIIKMVGIKMTCHFSCLLHSESANRPKKHMTSELISIRNIYTDTRAIYSYIDRYITNSHSAHFFQLIQVICVPLEIGFDLVANDLFHHNFVFCFLHCHRLSADLWPILVLALQKSFH